MRSARSARIPLGVAVAGVASAAFLASSDPPKRKPAARPASAARTLDALAAGERVPSGVREPSGVAYHARLDRLFVVGDEGTLAELDASGKVLRSSPFDGNLEDVVVLPTGKLLILSEDSAELILYDPVARRRTGRFRLDAAALLGEPPRDRSNGFEGLAYEDAEGGKGGRLFLVHQRAPALIVSVAWDPASTGGAVGGSAVRGRWKLRGHEDLTAAAFVPSLGRLLVIAEKTDRLLIVGRDGQLEAEAPLPGLQQEGLCLDADGTLWVADDREGTLRRLPGALEALTAGLEAAEPASP